MAYDYTSASYGMGYIVTREILEDNLYEQVSAQRAAALARVQQATDEYIARVFSRRAAPCSRYDRR